MTERWKNVEYSYAGAKVLVTGGTSGIGNGIAIAYRDAGAEVTIAGTRSAKSEYDGDLEGFDYRQYDAEDDASVDQLAGAMAELDILVNSAGVALYTAGHDEQDPDVFDRSLKLHLSSTHRLAQRCRPALAASRLPGGASVLMMASMSSFFAYEMAPAYGTAKTGLLGLTRQLAVSLAQQGIRVNALAVGLTRSRMSAGFFADPTLSEPLLASVPLGRHGEPHDVAGAALFLSSDAACWITGQTLPVDGGYSINR